MKLYIPAQVSLANHTLMRVWNLSSLPGHKREEDIEAAEATGNLLMRTFFASLSHPEDKQWQSVFIPLSSDPDHEMGLSITWWSRRTGLPGTVKVKIDTESKWIGVLKSKMVGGGYRPTKLMCPTKHYLPKSRFLHDVDTESYWLPTYAVDEDTVATGPGVGADAFYAGMFASTVVINDFVRMCLARNDLLAEIDDIINSPEIHFGTRACDELVYLKELAGVMEKTFEGVSLMDDFGDIKKGTAAVGPIPKVVVPEPEAAKEEKYAGIWGAFG